MYEEHSVVILFVKVIPNSSRNVIVGWVGDSLKIKVMAQPERGRANATVIKLLMAALKVKKERVELIAGQTNANKKIHLHQISLSQLEQQLNL